MVLISIKFHIIKGVKDIETFKVQDLFRLYFNIFEFLLLVKQINFSKSILTLSISK